MNCKDGSASAINVEDKSSSYDILSLQLLSIFHFIDHQKSFVHCSMMLTHRPSEKHFPLHYVHAKHLFANQSIPPIPTIAKKYIQI